MNSFFNYTFSRSFGLNHLFHRAFTMNTLSASRFYYYFTIWIHHLNSWYVSRIDFEFSIVFANSLLIHFLSLILYKFTTYFTTLLYTLNPQSHSWFYYEFTITKNSLCIHYLLHDFTRNSWFVREFTLNPLFFSRNYYELTIFFAISLLNHNLIPEITMNTLFFAESIWFHSLLRDFPMDSLTVSRIHFESIYFLPNHYRCTIYFAISQGLHCLFR